MASMVYQPEFYHREVAFCKVYGSKNKAAVESILLKNRISYFIEMQNEPLLRRLFSSGKNKEKSIFIFNINDADVERATGLMQEYSDCLIVKGEHGGKR